MLKHRRGAQARACVWVLICSFVLASPALFAYPTTWEFKGTVTTSDGAFSGIIPLGSPIRILVSFDTAEEPSGTQASANGPGFRFNYVGAPSLRFAIFGGSCNPCTPTPIEAKNSIIVRDSYSNTSEYAPLDGYSFTLDTDPDNDNVGFQVILRGPSTDFTPEIVVIPSGGDPLPAEPDPRIVRMAIAGFNAYVKDSPADSLQASFQSVSIPTYGTYYFLSARHCLYPDATLPTGTPYLGDDCIPGGGVAPNRAAEIGGGAGQADFSRTLILSFPTPDTSDDPAAVDELGTLFGAIAFGGPGGLPVLRGSSRPTAVGRTNSNLLAYQQYAFNGSEPTPLQLVVDLDYTIHSHPSVTYYPPENQVQPGVKIQTGLSPGGATFSTILSVVDGDLIPPVAMGAADFGSLVCGNENNLELPNGEPWPTGSILGNAIFDSDESEEGAQSVRLSVLACDGNDISNVPVEVGPGDSFYLATSVQTPARGIKDQNGNPAPGATADGFVDAANTIRVIPDPEAPPEVLQQLAAGIAPVCEDCDFAPEIAMDLKPGDAQNVIKLGSKSVISVALFGSAALEISDVNASSLRLGTTAPRASKGKPKCTTEDNNLDGLPDLVCQFDNEPGNWQLGQTIATLSGVLASGEAILASDKVVVK